MKVRALDTYQRLNVNDSELKRKPVAGEVFEVSNDRLDTLLGNNSFGEAFVERVIEKNTIEKTTIEKKATKKKIEKR